MQKLRIAFGADKFQKRHENLVALANEALSRKNYEVFWFDFEKVYRQDGIVYLPLRKLSGRVRMTKKKMLSDGPVIPTDAELLDAVIIKKDPPQSHRTLNLLKSVCKVTLIVNDPHGILRYESKNYLKKLKGLTVPTFFSSKVAEIETRVRTLKNCVIKRERGFGGKGVYHIFTSDGKFYEESFATKKPRRINLRSFLKKVTRDGRDDIIIVKYLKNVTKGDKRIIVLDNKVLGAFLRLPGKKGWLCNISSGGSAKRTQLTSEENRLVQEIEKRFSVDRPTMMGIDTLEDDDGKRVVSEVNTTNVGGTYLIEKLYKRPISRDIIDWVERKIHGN